jgi:RNA polymerase sigma factor (sigma-70 family)
MSSDRGSLAGGQRAREYRFGRLYADHARQVLSYSLRRAGDRDVAADVVAETFLVAWRRLDDVPSGDQARMWLYGVARRVLANQQRGERRRHRLAEQLAGELAIALDALPALEPNVSPIRDALSRLSSEDQEVLRLVAWEELTPREIAAVLGITQIAARSRLHRARKRLSVQLDQVSVGDVFDPSNVQEAL